MAETSSRYAPLIESARRVLETNRLQGASDWDGRTYDFVCPSLETYPFQWLWDSAFHAISLLHVDPALAKQEIRCLLQGAQPDGFLPHMLLWDTTGREAQLQQYDVVLADPHFTATIQPPVLARAVERIYQATTDREFLAEVLPSILRAFEWLASNRDPDQDGLLAIIQPDESGLDASPKYDLPMGISGRASLVAPEQRAALQRLIERYQEARGDQAQLLQLGAFQVEEVMFNAIYGDGLRCLGRLLGAVPELQLPPPWAGRGQAPYLAGELNARAEKVTAALLDKCWDEESGVFWDLWGQDESPLKVLTITSLFPLILEDLPEEIVRRLLGEHLLNPAEFWTRYPVPSVALDEPSFDPSFRSQAIWRGPTWVNTNWYLYGGLARHGYEDIATELANRTFDMVLRGGQREFFNPLTGEGYGAGDFGWTSLVLDLLHAEGHL
jgi:glycogen debranching enzyme